MNILIATAHPFLPQMVGGLQRSSNELAERLIARGHKVSFLCALMPDGYLGVRGRVALKAGRRKAVVDRGQGYQVYRGWFPWEGMAEVCAREGVDVVVVLAREPVRMAAAAQACGRPVVMMLQDVEFEQHGGDFKALGAVVCAANSGFTARKYAQEFEVSPSVIHPMINAEKYKTVSSRENVTFINTHPKKGLEIAIEVAKRLPDVPFHFVEAWPLSHAERTDLKARLAALGNVEFSMPVKDMRAIYERAKIVIAPSRWEEAFGRVGAEPQFSGIPVVATNIGGLPEAVGDGGVLIDVDAGADAWAQAVHALWSDEALYEGLSAKALAHSGREAMQIEAQMDAWGRVIESALAGAAS